MSEQTQDLQPANPGSAEKPSKPSNGGWKAILLFYRKPLIVSAHVVVFVGALVLAFLFAFNMQLLRRWAVYPFPVLLAAVLPIKLVVFGWFDQYRGWWRYVGMSDLLQIAKASLISTVLLMALWYSYGWFGYRVVPASSVETVQEKVHLLEKQLSEALTSEETLRLRQQYYNLKGLENLLSVSQIPVLRKQSQALPINSPERLRLELEIERNVEFQKTLESVIMLDLFTTIMLLSGLRMLIRLYHEEFFAESRGALRRFLIIGAGNAGEALLRELMRRKDTPYQVVGFVDDDPAKYRMKIHGVPVLGTVEQLPQICQKYSIDEIAIAIPSATPKQMRRVVQICQGTKLRFSTVPSITDIASGKLRVSQIRDVDINDLLGREEVKLDVEGIQRFLRGKTILVTGAGGSIGSEMCRQVCGFGPRCLLLLEQAENPLFFIEGELRKTFPNVPLEPLICDITDRVRVDQIFDRYRPEVVIHAAAHKHVPLMELNPGEAIKNNVIGTMNVANAADRIGSEHFVMISTDKAVNPTSIMGSSKRIAEMYIQDLNNTSKTHFVTVRFGNVLGSNGSVVPIFKKQIAEGGPVTVTHPEMRRYFMTIPEASQLVLQAAAIGKGGEIFVLDMGEPVKIVDLARDLITLSGFRPGEDIEIVFTGLRPGEKLFEELSIAGEDMVPTVHPKIAVWKNIPKDRQFLRTHIQQLIEAAYAQDRRRIVELIKILIPQYMGMNSMES
jgi:FlaA1/EpsC-like NDP-sugar epimerase